VRDESTDDTRIVLEIKKEADPQMVMAYLYKHTPLATSVGMDFTCLIPTENPDVPGPARLSLRDMLRHFLDFRMEVSRSACASSRRSCCAASMSLRGLRRSSTRSTRPFASFASRRARRMPPTSS
jgi:DNA gyrase/topoisomerase IV subunit A